MIQLRLAGWRFRLEWVVVHLVAGLIIALFMNVVAGELLWVLPILTLGGAPIVALAQTPVVGRYIDQPRWWLLATGAGWLVGWLASVPAAGFVTIVMVMGGRMMSTTAGGTILGAVSMLSVGAALGWCQWLVLKRYIPSAWKWIAISALCWAIAWIPAWLFGEYLYFNDSSGALIRSVEGALAGGIFALVSGLPLYRLLRRAAASVDAAATDAAETVPDSQGMLA
jgi:hypothetical protein